MSKVNFVARADIGLSDAPLQKNLSIFRNFSPLARAKTLARMDNVEQLRAWTKERKNFALDNLADLLEQFEAEVTKLGGQVHWAETTDDLNQIVIDICKQRQAEKIVKGKSMVSEEAQLTHALIDAGFDTLETDLGEYIIQLAEEPPSHIIGPAIHKTFEQVVELFEQHHPLGERDLPDAKAVMFEARQLLREKFLEADIGITGANYLIAESGTVGLVTNEGNGDLCSSLPKTHIVVTSIDKIVPDFDTAMAVQRLLVPSATAQDITCYTSFYTGPKRTDDADGPENFHVVLLDNKRSDILQSKYKDILRCIRCSACLNHCPIYTRTGGHAYGDVYPGPMGSVWTPLLNGLENSHDLPNACTTCNRCAEVCPMEIPLPDMLRDLRRDEQQAGLQPKRWTLGMKIAMWLFRQPTLFRWTTKLTARFLKHRAMNTNAVKHLPVNNGWMEVRDFPAPEGDTFFERLKKQRK
ncbi:LutB/LldF family L-lactate oxidation iron-sulfur protein [Aurantivibrio plasticivorans]